MAGNLTVPLDSTNTITANNIWVTSSGTFIAGNSTNPFTGTLQIILTGSRSSPGVAIGTTSVNKVLANNGGVYLFGVAPATISTRLTASVTVGATIITVADSTGWKVGDTIVIGTTTSEIIQSERATIFAITGNTITISKALNYAHWGAATIQLTKNNLIIDSRAVVSHLTRNIVITVDRANSEWGCTLWALNFKDSYGQVWNPSTFVSGVQFNGCSQKDSPQAAVMVEAGVPNVMIDKSSFTDSLGVSINVASNVVSITNNVAHVTNKHAVLVNSQTS